MRSKLSQCNAQTINSTNVLQCFLYLQEWCTNFKSRKVAALCARDLRQWDCSNCHLITLRFIIPARITTSICHALPLVYIPCFSVSVSDYNWPWMLLHIHRCRYTLLTRINERMNVARSIGSSFFFKRLNLNKLKLKGNEKIEALYRKNKCENVHVLYQVIVNVVCFSSLA